MKVTKKIPFDVNRISEGKVVDCNGRPLRIIATDRVSPNNNYPVVALCPCSEDGSEHIETFTIDGYYTSTSKQNGKKPRLFIEIEEEVEPQFEPFQKVLVRDSEGQEWRGAFFSHVCSDERYKYVVIGNAAWEQCIPYEGNEDLLNPTNSSK